MGQKKHLEKTYGEKRLRWLAIFMGESKKHYRNVCFWIPGGKSTDSMTRLKTI